MDGQEGSAPRVKDYVHPSINPFTQQATIHVDLDEKRAKTAAAEKAKGTTEEAKPKFSDTLKEMAPYLLPLASAWLPDAQALLGPNDKASKASLQQARVGHDLIDINESIYLKLNSKTPMEPREPGHHKNPDGSSFDVSDKGLITNFTTAPTADYPKGLTYGNIKYDANNEMISCDTPWTTFERTTPSNENGFATWTSKHNGQPVIYIGAGASQWIGETSVSEHGFHAFVSNGQHPNYLYTRAGNGSLVYTHPTTENGATTGLETVATLPDKSQVTHNTKFGTDKAIPENKVLVFDPTRTKVNTIEIDATKDEFKIVDRQDITPKNPEMQEMAAKAREQMRGSTDPVGDIKRSLQKIGGLRAATVQRIGNSYAVDAHFDQGSTEPAVRLGRRLVTPNETHIAPDVSFQFTPSDGGFKLTDLHGFSSSVTVLGRTLPTHPTSLFVGRDRYGPLVDVHGYAQLRRRQIHKELPLRQNNFEPGCSIREMMDDPNQLRSMSSALRLFQNNTDVDRININRVARGYHDLTVDSSGPTHIRLNEELIDNGLTIDSIDLDKQMFARLSNETNGVKMDYIRGMTVNVASPIVGDVQIQPVKAGIKNDASGLPVLEIEIKNPQLEGSSLAVEVGGTPQKPQLKNATLKVKVPVEKLMAAAQGPKN